MLLGRPEFGALLAKERYPITPVSLFPFLLSRLVSLFRLFPSSDHIRFSSLEPHSKLSHLLSHLRLSSCFAPA